MVKLKRNKGLFEHRLWYKSTQGDSDTVYVKSPKIRLTKKEACKLINKKRKGTGMRCKTIKRDEITGVSF